MFSSVAQSCPTLCDPMNRSTPGLPVHHQLPELTQTHVYQVGDAIQPSHPLASPSAPICHCVTCACKTEANMQPKYAVASNRGKDPSPGSTTHWPQLLTEHLLKSPPPTHLCQQHPRVHEHQLCQHLPLIQRTGLPAALENKG